MSITEKLCKLIQENEHAKELFKTIVQTAPRDAKQDYFDRMYKVIVDAFEETEADK